MLNANFSILFNLGENSAYFWSTEPDISKNINSLMVLSQNVVISGHTHLFVLDHMLS